MGPNTRPMKNVRRTAQPDTSCQHADGGYHNWMVYEHNATWTKLDCFCSRCSVRCTMTYTDYVAIHKAASEWWNAYIRTQAIQRTSTS